MRSETLRLNASSRARSSSSRRSAAARARGQGLALSRGGLALFGNLREILVDSRQLRGQLRLARAEARARLVDDRAIQAEAAGHLEREAAAGRTVDQLVGRREAYRVERKRRALHAVAWSARRS